MKVINNYGGRSDAGVSTDILPPPPPYSPSGSYTVTLGDVLSVLVPKTTHGIISPIRITLLNVLNQDMDVYYEIRVNGDVYVECNWSLLNHKLIIY